MSVMYLLIMLSLIMASGFVIAFVWAIRSGQYDDKYTPSVRVLFDDHPVSDEKPAENSEGEESDEGAETASDVYRKNTSAEDEHRVSDK